MQNDDPRNDYVRAEAALNEMIQQIRDADEKLGDDEVSRQQHARYVRDLADLVGWAETAADLADGEGEVGYASAGGE